MKNTLLTLSLLLCTSPVRAADWPAWGGDYTRNMVNGTEQSMPTQWDVKTGKNIKWQADLGSQSYGNPVIAGGRVYAGTNNEGLRDPAINGDRGVLLCFSEADGKFLWQAVFDKLESGRVNDWPLQGICSTIAVESDRGYFVNNRCEVVCLDLKGLMDGKNDGMQDEKYTGNDKADILWSYDMMEELASFPHNLATSSPALGSNYVFVVTGNGVDEAHLQLPSPTAPSFLALDKLTGEPAWEFTVSGRILHGQWSSPAIGTVNGQTQVIFPGGDGWIYALDPANGSLIWKFDCNPKESEWELGGYGTRNNIIATPVILNNTVYIGVGQDPEHGTGIGHLHAIDATGTGDVTATHARWHLGGADFGRTMSTVAVKDDLLYVCDLAGTFYCLNAKTGVPHWKHELAAAVWSSPMVVDGKVYIGDEDGDVLIVEHGKEKKIINEINMGASVYTTPSPANGVLYISTRSKLYAIANPTKE